MTKTFCGAMVALAGGGGIAVADPPTDGDMLGVTVSASSTLTAKSKTYQPWYPLAPDQLHARFWCEGKPDEGLGETLVVTLASPTKLDSVTIEAGVWRSEFENGVRKWKDGELFRANNIITGLDLITDDGKVRSISVPEERKPVEVALGGGPIKQLTLKITKVVRGKMNDSCISGLELHPASPVAIVLGVDATALAALAPTFAKLHDAIETCSEPELRAHVKFPFSYGMTRGNDKGLGYKKSRDAAALVKACKAFTFSAFTNEDHAAYRISPDAPGAVTFHNDLLDWHLVLDGSAWKLAGLDDNTP